MIEKQALLGVVCNPDLKSSNKLLLLYLLITSIGGQTSISNSNISKTIGISKIAVIKGLQELSKSGIIHREIKLNDSMEGFIERRITLLKNI